MRTESCMGVRACIVYMHVSMHVSVHMYVYIMCINFCVSILSVLVPPVPSKVCGKPEEFEVCLADGREVAKPMQGILKLGNL